MSGWPRSRKSPTRFSRPSSAWPSVITRSSSRTRPRTVIRRLAHAPLTPDQQQDANFTLLYSYALGHQPAKADQALAAYLSQHPGDTRAQEIRIEIGNELLKRGDAQGALAQADSSLKEFPDGPNVASAIVLKVSALNALGRGQEAQAAGDEFMKSHAGNPAAVNIALTTAQNQAASGDLNGALATYQKVRDTAKTKELQAAGAAGYIQTLQSLGRLDDVIKEAKDFAAKFPDSTVLPNILVISAVALDQKHDPAAIAALQDEAKNSPTIRSRPSRFPTL